MNEILLFALIIVVVTFLTVRNRRKQTPSSSEQSGDATASNSKAAMDLPPRRAVADRELKGFLDAMPEQYIVVIVDLETNGLSPGDSVLSCGAIKGSVERRTGEVTELATFERYYFPREDWNPQALAVNGLREDAIRRRRLDSGQEYPSHFDEDSAFEQFCREADAMVSHNYAFDSSFLRFPLPKKAFCTMQSNTDIVAIPRRHDPTTYKLPSLRETALHYGVKFADESLHQATYDARITFQIFIRMVGRYVEAKGGLRDEK